MSHQDLSGLEEILAMVPLDWDLRLALIQVYVLHGQNDEAKRLVRESPKEAGPVPAHIQHRLHRLLVEGVSAAEEFAREDAASKVDELVCGVSEESGAGNAVSIE